MINRSGYEIDNPINHPNLTFDRLSFRGTKQFKNGLIPALQ